MTKPITVQSTFLSEDCIPKSTLLIRIISLLHPLRRKAVSAGISANRFPSRSSAATPCHAIHGFTMSNFANLGDSMRPGTVRAEKYAENGMTGAQRLVVGKKAIGVVMVDGGWGGEEGFGVDCI